MEKPCMKLTKVDFGFSDCTATAIYDWDDDACGWRLVRVKGNPEIYVPVFIKG